MIYSPQKTIIKITDKHFPYAISEETIAADGVLGINLGVIFENNDSRVVSYPLASDIFKVAGAVQNYVHGGCSPQEMLVPLVDVKVERKKRNKCCRDFTCKSYK